MSGNDRFMQMLLSVAWVFGRPAFCDVMIRSCSVAYILMRWILCGDFFATLRVIFAISPGLYLSLSPICLAEFWRRFIWSLSSGISLLPKVLIVSKMPNPRLIELLIETLASFTNLLF